MKVINFDMWKICYRNTRYFLIFIFPALAYCQLQPFSAKIHLGIEADQSIESLVASYLNREIRSIGDVEVTDDNPQWYLGVIAVEDYSEAGNILGYTISSVVHSTVPVGAYLDERLEVISNESQIDSLATLVARIEIFLTKKYLSTFDNLVTFHGHWIQSGGPDDLKKMCELVISHFDGEYLEEARRRHRSPE